jgi:hypothetical protein
MNPPAHSEAQPWTPSRRDRMAWLPIPLLLAAIIAARMAGLRDTYESYALLLLLSFTFYTLVSLGTLYIIGRSFLGIGSPGLLFLECGVLLWSLRNLSMRMRHLRQQFSVAPVRYLVTPVC